MARYIDAEKLEKKGWSASRTYPQDAHTMVYETKKMTAFPTADVVERKRGKWLNKFVDGLGYNGLEFECSECGKRSAGRSNYCAYCGAQMKSE